MRDAILTLLPLITFMLLPVWIPLIAVTVGSVVDLFTGRVPARPVVPAKPQPAPRHITLAAQSA